MKIDVELLNPLTKFKKEKHYDRRNQRKES